MFYYIIIIYTLKSIVDNIFFVSNCLTAWDIAGKGKYEDLTRKLVENYNHSLVLRRFLEKLDDDKLDKLVKNADKQLFSKLIDEVTSMDNGIDLLKLSTPILRLLSKEKN